MTPKEIATIFKYTRPSKIAKPLGYVHRLEMWESVVLSMSERMDEIYKGWNNEMFLVACGFYEDTK